MKGTFYFWVFMMDMAIAIFTHTYFFFALMAVLFLFGITGMIQDRILQTLDSQIEYHLNWFDYECRKDIYMDIKFTHLIFGRLAEYKGFSTEC